MDPPQASPSAPVTRLLEYQASGVGSDEALAFFDALPVLQVSDMMGRWRGSGLHSGHPMDGLLESFGWYGKEFVHADCAHPLLFKNGAGTIVALQSKNAPLRLMSKMRVQGTALNRALFAAALPLLRTDEPGARLRMVEHRGKVSAAMIYNYLPVLDSFRGVDRDTVLGLMDLQTMPQPFFFVLRRDV